MLTGNVRYRVGWRKRLIVQVEHASPLKWPHGFHYPGFVGWRDATRHDIRELTKLNRSKELGGPYIPQAGYCSATGGCCYYADQSKFIYPEWKYGKNQAPPTRSPTPPEAG